MRARVSLAAPVLALLAAGTVAAQQAAVPLEGDPSRRERLDALQGKPAPELEVARWANGKAVKLSDLKGKVVLLDFWGTWCGPCVAAVPHAKEMQEKYGPKGLVLIGVHTPFSADNLDSFIKEKGINYAVALDATADPGGRKGKTIERYQVDSFPDYYLVDRKGVLRYADVQNRSVDAAVEQLLAEQP